MAIYYVDLENGNDSNDGFSFANRKKTIQSATQSTTGWNPGDSVRVMGSPVQTNMGQNATFTNKSSTVTLTSAVTANIYTDGAWTASANVTCAADATWFTEGSNSSRSDIAAAFVTGIVSYFNTGTLNLSGYQQVSFNIRSSQQIAANVLKLRLSTTTGGTTATHEFTIDVQLSADKWYTLTYDNAANLNSAIQSVALVAISDPGAESVYIDNILACKSKASVDSLTLSSVIGKNDGFWWQIRSINGTTVTIATNTPTGPGGRGYYGVTETVAIWKREAIRGYTSTSTDFQTIAGGANGTLDKYNDISGGWNRTDMSTQTQETLIDGLNHTLNGIAIATNGGSYVSFSKFGFVRYNVDLAWQASQSLISDVFSAGSYNSSIDLSTGPPNNVTVKNAKLCFGSINTFNCSGLLVEDSYVYSGGSLSYGVKVSSGAICRNVESSNNGGMGFDCAPNAAAGSTSFIELYQCTAKDNTQWGLDADVTSGNQVTYISLFGWTTSGNSTGSINTVSTTRLTIVGSSMSEADKYQVSQLNIQAYESLGGIGIRSQFENGADNADQYFGAGGVTPQGSIQRDFTMMHGGLGASWKFAPLGPVLNSWRPLNACIATIPVLANTSVTVKVWCRRTSTGLYLRLRIPAKLPGLYPDKVASMAAPADTWELVTLPVATPTVNGVVEVWAEVWGGTTFSGWTHEVIVT